MQNQLRALLAFDLVAYERAIENKTIAHAAITRVKAEVFRTSLIKENGKASPADDAPWITSYGSATSAVETALQIRARLADEGLPPLALACDVGDVLNAGSGVFGAVTEAAAALLTASTPGEIVISTAARDALNPTLRPSFTRDDTAAAPTMWRCPADVEPPPLDGRRKLLIISKASGGAETWEEDLAVTIAGDLVHQFESAPWVAPTLHGPCPDAAYTLKVRLTHVDTRLALFASVSDAATEIIWRGDSAGDVSDPISWRRKAVKAIADAAFDAICAKETIRIEKTKTDDMSAEDSIAAAYFSCQGFSPEGNDLGLEFASGAVERAPDMAEAYATALSLYFAATARGGGRTINRLASSYRLWRSRGAAVTRSNPHLDVNLAIAAYRENLDPAALKQALDRGVGRDPFNVSLLAISSFAYVWMGSATSVLNFAERGLRIGERHSLWPVLCAATGRALIMVGQDEAALELARKGLDIAPDYGALHDNVSAASAYLGRLAEAKAALSYTKDWYAGEQTIAHRRRRAGYLDTPTTRRFFEGLRLAGLAES